MWTMTSEEKTGAQFFAGGMGLMLLSAIQMDRERKMGGPVVHRNDLQALSFFAGIGLVLYGANRYAPGTGWIAGGLFLGVGEINKARRAKGKPILEFPPGIEFSLFSKAEP
jgi:hypothetical protein